MFINAGKTHVSRYDRRAPVHISIVDPGDDDTPLSLCSGREIAPIRDQNQIEITCLACQVGVQELQSMLVS